LIIISKPYEWLIATDIFGETKQVKEFAGSLGENQTVKIVSPYQNQPVFCIEKLAYQHFCLVGGIDHYKNILRSTLLASSECKVIIGFSAGAAALYALLSEVELNKKPQIYLFYPSQIRHMLSLEPKINCNIIFPASEPHFDIKAVIDDLKRRSQIKIQHTHYQHGFMNKLSKGFSQEGYTFYSHYFSPNF
jgi:hypothetical protein